MMLAMDIDYELARKELDTHNSNIWPEWDDKHLCFGEALQLWELANADRARMLNGIYDANLRTTAVGDFRYNGTVIGALLHGIEGLRDALQSTILDQDGRVLPDKVALVQEKNPSLIYAFKDAEGQTRHSISGILGRIENFETYLKAALKLGCDIIDS